MIHDVIVLGGGSAGFLAALALKKKMPELAVTVIRSKEIGVIGVGEATTVALPKMLHGYLGLEPAEFYRTVETTWKLGIRFLWGPRPFFDYTFGYQMDWKWSNLSRTNGYYCQDDFTYVDTLSALMSHDKAFVRLPGGDPLMGTGDYSYGYHIENEKFVGYLEARALEAGIAIREDTLREALVGPEGIAGLALASGTTARADLYIDCSGFASLLLGKALGEPYRSFRSTLFDDRAVTGGWKRTSEPIKPYTTAETMDCGWCWQIDHVDRINRGYVYSTAFITDAQAEAEFRAKNPKVESTRLVRFVTGRYERSWVKNVVGIGNSSGFVEPLESTGLAVICDESRMLADTLRESGRDPSASRVMVYNSAFGREWDSIRYFLGTHFKFNTRLDTPYWQASRADVDIGPAERVVEFYRENGPSTQGRTTLLTQNDIFGMEGYLCLLAGQRVPCRVPQPSHAERAVWSGIRAENRIRALTALDTLAARAAILAPGYRWPDHFRE